MNKLSQNIIHSLSSGQVITSIHDVVKELVENSLDAGASRIDIRLDNYGLDKIEVCDDGKGVPADEVQYMTLPHYTSKFSCIDNFDTLSTYGFRGEALSSLCSVSDVSITTKTCKDEFAFTYTFDHAGLVISTKVSPPVAGTTVQILNIFKIHPVRRQFYDNLKKKKEELKHIETLLNAFGIITPKLRISLTHNKSIICMKNSLPDLTTSLSNVIGNNVMSCMKHKVFSDSALQLHLEAFFPDSLNINLVTRCQNDRAFFFVNKRPITFKLFDKLVKSSYYASLKMGENSSSSRFPIYCVSIEIPPYSFDINLEPNKTRILFRNKEAVLDVFNRILADVYQPSSEVAILIQPKNLRESKENHNEGKENPIITAVTENEIKSVSEPSKKNSEVSSNVVITTSEHLTTTGFFDDSINSMNCRNLEEENTDEMNNIELDLIDSLINKDYAASNQKNLKVSTDSTKINEMPTTADEQRKNHSHKLDAGFIEDDFNCNWRKGKIKDCDGQVIESVQVLLPHSKRSFSQMKIDERRTDEVERNKDGSSSDNSSLNSANKKQCLQTDINQPTLLSLGISTKSAECSTKQLEHMKYEQANKRSSPSDLPLTISAVFEEDKATYGPEKQAEISANGQSVKMKLTKLKRNKSPNIDRQIMKAEASKMKEKIVQVKVILIECSLSSIDLKSKNRVIFNRKRDQLRLIGPLSKGLWLTSLKEKLFIFNYFQGKELFLYQQLISNHSISAKMLEKPLEINESLIGGAANWIVLMEMKSSPTQPLSAFCITDKRLVANGIHVKKWFDISSQSMRAEITHVPHSLSFCGTDDLQEIIQKIVINPSIDLTESRTSKIKNYLKSETMRIVHQMPLNVPDGEVKQFWKEFGHLVHLDSRCLHGKKILNPIYDLSGHNSELI